MEKDQAEDVKSPFNGMKLDMYQTKARFFAKYPVSYKIIYPALGMNGEAGEVAEKVKKVLRDDHGQLTKETRDAILAEIGDVLWYCAQLATDLNASLGDIAEANIAKLNSRLQRGVIGGSGDNR